MILERKSRNADAFQSPLNTLVQVDVAEITPEDPFCKKYKHSLIDFFSKSYTKTRLELEHESRDNVIATQRESSADSRDSIHFSGPETRKPEMYVLLRERETLSAAKRMITIDS